MLASGLSLESESQQISFGLQDSPQYSNQSQQCCSLEGLDFIIELLLFSPGEFFTSVLADGLSWEFE